MKTPEKIQNLSDSFTALGFRSDIIHFTWPDNTPGFVIHVGEVLCECHNGNGELLEYYSNEPLLTLSFTESELKDIESHKSIMFIDDINVQNEERAKKCPKGSIR